jgi:hypothetical protein
LTNSPESLSWASAHEAIPNHIIRTENFLTIPRRSPAKLLTYISLWHKNKANVAQKCLKFPLLCQ